MTQIVIGIPGPWQDKEEVIRSLTNICLPVRFSLNNVTISDSISGIDYNLDIYEYTPNLAHAFNCAGQEQLTDNLLEIISNHKSTVYIVANLSSDFLLHKYLNAAYALMNLGVQLLDAGGYAVKVESSGIAHPPERWRYYAQQNTILSAYNAFVTLVSDNDYYYTCGMHTFGKPDASLTTTPVIEDARVVVHACNQYQLLEDSVFSDGSKFVISAHGPEFTLTHCAYGYEESSLLNNPFGRWHLKTSDTSHALEHRPTPKFIAFGEKDSELRDSIQQARASLPWLIQNFNSPYEYGYYLLKIHLRDGDDSAYFWTRLVRVFETDIVVRLFELPPEFPHFSIDEDLIITLSEVYDWCIMRNGTLIGGYSLRIHRNRMSAHDRHNYDIYSGTISYAPLPVIINNER